jgi:hypothetical protein
MEAINSVELLWKTFEFYFLEPFFFSSFLFATTLFCLFSLSILAFLFVTFFSSFFSVCNPPSFLPYLPSFSLFYLFCSSGFLPISLRLSV